MNLTQQILFKRGNTAQVSSYVGPIGEPLLDTESYTVYVADGITPGGRLVGGNVLINSIANIAATVSTLGGNISSLTQNIYGNANVAAYLPTSPTITGLISSFAAYETWTNASIAAFSATSNVSVAAYLLIAPTILAIDANVTAANAAITSTNANLTAANVNIALTNANISAYEMWANAAMASTNANVSSNLNTYENYANVRIQTLEANVGAYENYASIRIQSIDANIGAYETLVNAAIALTNANLSAYETWANNQVSTINSNIGAYEIWASAAIGSTTATIAAYEIWANSAISSTNANVTAYEIWASAAIGSTTATIAAYEIWANAAIALTNANASSTSANVTAYEIWANSAISSTNANVTAYETLANAAISSTNANIAAYEIYANASIVSTNANINAYETLANAAISSTNANIAAYEIYANTAINLTNTNLTAANIAIVDLAASIVGIVTGTGFANVAQITATNAGISAYEAWANTVIGPTGSINSGINAYEAWANASISSANANISALNSGLGAYETWANTAIGFTNTNVTAANSAISSLNAGMTAANIVIGRLSTNVAAITTAVVGLIQGNLTAANAAISYLNANVSAYETWANSVLGTLTTWHSTENYTEEITTVIPVSRTIGGTYSVSGIAISLANPAVITLANHGYVGGSQVVFSTTGALPVAITAGVVYEVLAANLTANTFEVSLTDGGTPINTTSNTQWGIHLISIPVNAVSFDNATIGDGITVTVLPGSKWTITSTVTATSWANVAIQNLSDTVGAYETWANASIASTDANLNAYETWANAAISSLDAWQFTEKYTSEINTIITSSQIIGNSSVVTGVTVSIATPAVITIANHGYVGGSQVVFSTTGALPSGLTVGQIYYVVAPGLTSGTFNIATTDGGAALATGGTQSGVHSIGALVSAVSYDNATIGDVVGADITVTVLPGSKWTIETSAQPVGINYSMVINGKLFTWTGGLLTSVV